MLFMQENAITKAEVISISFENTEKITNEIPAFKCRVLLVLPQVNRPLILSKLYSFDKPEKMGDLMAETMWRLLEIGEKEIITEEQIFSIIEEICFKEKEVK